MTAGDILDAHANLLPIDLLFNKVLFQATVHLASLLPTHLLHLPVCKAAKCYIKKHRSPLHNLFSTTTFIPTSVEKIVPTCQCPNYIPSFTTHIPDGKPAALAVTEDHHQKAHITIYCDGSGFEGNIGTSAVLYINAVETNLLQYHLGLATNHTIYEGEIVGLSLALHMLSILQTHLHTYTGIGSDSQATIPALDNQCLHPAHYLLDHVHDAAENLHISQHYLQSPRVYKC